jgi:hypothetical protein
MGAASKGLAVILRLGELSCSVIVLGILGRFLAIVGQANTYADSRIVYAVVVASIAIAFSIIFFPPFTYSFMAFPVDFILFTLFLVAFCLLETVRTNKPPFSWNALTHSQAHRYQHLQLGLVLELLGFLLGRILEKPLCRQRPQGYWLGWLLSLENGSCLYLHVIHGISVQRVFGKNAPLFHDYATPAS